MSSRFQGFLLRFLGLNRNLRVYCLAAVFNSFRRAVLGGLFVVFCGNLGMPLLLFGLMSSISEGFRIVLSVYAGNLTDRIGRKPFIVSDSLLGLLLPLTAYLCNDWLWLLPSLIFTSFIESLSQPADKAFIGDTTNKETRATATATLNLVGSLPAAIAPILGGLIAQYWNSIRPLFILQILFGLIASLILLIQLEESIPRKKREEKQMKSQRFSISDQLQNLLTSYKKGYQESAAVGSTLVWIIVLIGITPFMFGMSRFWNIYFVEELKASYFLIGALSSACGLAVALVALPVGKIADKMGRRPLIVVGMYIWAFHSLGWLFIPNSIWIPLWGAFGTAGGYAHGHLVTVLTYDIIPEEKRGLILGFIYGLVGGTTGLVGPLFGGFVWDTLGSRMTIFLASILAFLKAIICTLYIYDPRHRHRTGASVVASSPVV